MKTSFSLLLLLPTTIAGAQRAEPGRVDFQRGDRLRVEGRYESVQRDGSIRRVLRLDRDGAAEIVTEARDAKRDRRGWDRNDTKRFGRTALEAMQDRPVRHTGRWRWRDDEIVVQLTDLRIGGDRWDSVEMRLKRNDDGLVFDRNSETYGENRIVFRRDGGWDGGRPNLGPRLGYVRYDRDTLPIDSIELGYGRRETGRLRIRAGGRLIELRGDTLRDGDGVTFRLPDNAGEYRLTMREGRVERITGRGELDRRRVEMTDRSDRG